MTAQMFHWKDVLARLARDEDRTLVEMQSELDTLNAQSVQAIDLAARYMHEATEIEEKISNLRDEMNRYRLDANNREHPQKDVD